MSENISIKDQLKKLVELQKLDTQILNFKKDKEDKPRELSQLQERFNSNKQKTEELKKEVDTLLVKRKEKELELSAKEETIKKSQQQLYTLKTNKEYAAKLKEIDGVKADKSVIEDELIGVFDMIDSKKDQLASEQERLKLEEQKLSIEREKINNQIKEIDQALETLVNKRKQLAQDIESKILSQYDKVLDNRAGVAIVPVKNDTCQGCFMNVTPQAINEIKMHDRIIICQMCSRILYLEEDLGG
ncbi:MAG: C4-type zinc ribbon domain-containing protein [Candidatus Omnitrophota bacterium]